MKCDTTEFLNLWNSSKPTKEIAMFYNVPVSWIRAKARHLKLQGHIVRSRVEQLSVTKKGISKSQAHKDKISETSKKRKCPEHLKQLYKQIFKGAGNPNWKGGIAGGQLVIRRSGEYKAWRDAVKYRDDYTCQFCSTRGGWLESHHIKPFDDIPQLRCSLLNGLTLCRKCHEKTFGKEHEFEQKCLERLCG